ncbi:MAG: hypothetical protein K9W44_04395 [Candidatus Lokiarchaeota archaeon]|nr:hypothetical protein [Candidatus Harpocratesius repetitus]
MEDVIDLDFFIIHHYNCSHCKIEVKSFSMIRCSVCKSKLCKDCNKNELCPTHYRKLSDLGKKKVERLKIIDKFFNVLLLSCFILFLILVFTHYFDQFEITTQTSNNNTIQTQTINYVIIYALIVQFGLLILNVIVHFVIRAQIRNVYYKDVKELKESHE